MSFSPSEHFLHVFSIAVHIDNCQPCLDSNNEDFHFFSQFYTAFLAGLEIFQLEDCHFTAFHAGDQSLDLQVLLAQVILRLFCVREVETAEIGGMRPFRLFVLLERVSFYLILGYFLEFEADFVVAGRLVDIAA